MGLNYHHFQCQIYMLYAPFFWLVPDSSLVNITNFTLLILRYPIFTKVKLLSLFCHSFMQGSYLQFSTVPLSLLLSFHCLFIKILLLPPHTAVPQLTRLTSILVHCSPHWYLSRLSILLNIFHY